ncbi:hypothetical protein AQUCO_00900581v1 [Aquilegia coerulea]|uniref:DRBM domain-containing protein n=1 Tax=Aquilegia coerulea TaxID=218851 RepID=A0A2G5EEW2_AQUCA|nr:hypothetical protein AQUCO_00900581v1 [Aquilegia coerulea]
MFKSKLQELCQQRQWELPNYSLNKDGPPHQPRFKASVLINSDSFDSPDFCKSSKEAQSEAARIAFQHFSLPKPVVSSSVSTPLSSSSSTSFSNASTVLRNIPIGEGNMLGKNEEVSNTSPSHGTAVVVKDDKDFGDVLYLYKGQLQIFAQKRNLSLPVYSCTREGSSHAPRFKAIVTVDGQCFESPEFFRTLREAEHAAAKVAFSSLSKDGIQEDDCPLYKNYLQELTRKEGFSIPNYMTTLSGASHVPTFTSTVEVEGGVYHGVAARTKKQAELNAAKVAYFSLKERQSKRIPAPLSNNGDAQGSLENVFSSLHSGITVVPAPLSHSDDAKVSLEDVFSSCRSRNTAVSAPLSHSGDAQVSLENVFSSSHSSITVVPVPLSHSGDDKVSLENVFSSSHSGITAVPAPLSHSGDAEGSLENAFSSSHSSITVAPAPLSPSGDAKVSLENVFSSSHSAVTAVPAPLSHSGAAQVTLENAISSSDSGITVIPAPLSHSGVAQVPHENGVSISHSSITVVPAPLSHSGNAQGSLENVSSSLSGVTVDFQRKLTWKDEDQEAPSDAIFSRRVKASADHSTTPLLDPGTNSKSRIKNTASLDVIYEHLQVPVPSIPSPEFGTLSPTTVLEGSNFSATDLNSNLLAKEGALLCNRVMVYPRKPKLEFPKGTTLLPITDDHWVAVNLEYPNE